jgi:hypothetical protein
MDNDIERVNNAQEFCRVLRLFFFMERHFLAVAVEPLPAHLSDVRYGFYEMTAERQHDQLALVRALCSRLFLGQLAVVLKNTALLTLMHAERPNFTEFCERLCRDAEKLIAKRERLPLLTIMEVLQCVAGRHHAVAPLLHPFILLYRYMYPPGPLTLT